MSASTKPPLTSISLASKYVALLMSDALVPKWSTINFALSFTTNFSSLVLWSTLNTALSDSSTLSA